MNIEQICIASFRSMFNERLEDGVDLTPKYIEMLVKEHCEPYMIVTQGFTHDLLANALDYMDWEYIAYHIKHPVFLEKYGYDYLKENKIEPRDQPITVRRIK